MKNLNTRLLRFTKLLEFGVALCLMVAIVIAAGMALLDNRLSHSRRFSVRTLFKRCTDNCCGN